MLQTEKKTVTKIDSGVVKIIHYIHRVNNNGSITQQIKKVHFWGRKGTKFILV
jgi:hypothetical protein